MKFTIATALFAAVFAAQAFNSSEWLEKRAVLDREAERLREAYSNCVAKVEVPAENITVPIENHPDGSVKASVSAAKAQWFADSGFVWGEGVKVCQFDETGKETGSITAKSCVVDRQTKSGWAEGPAKITYGRTVVEGVGIYFSFEEEYVRITAGTSIVSKDLKFGGLKL